MDIEEIRKDFPVLTRKINGKNIVYFDNAATTLKPLSVILATKEYYERNSSNIHRAVHTLSYEATEKYVLAHKKVAELIGAKSWREIIFTRNATEALNLLAYSLMWKLKEGDEIIISIAEHHSNIVPWQFLKRKIGVNLKFVDVDEKGELIEDEIYEKITERTKVISITGASNVLGTVNDIKKIAKRVKEIKKDVIFISDVAQLIPHRSIKISEDIDFIVASAHKMLGPTGIGFLWGKENLLEDMEPFLYGGDMISKVYLDKAEWNELPWKFEAGTPNIAGGIAFTSAIEYIQKLGYDFIEEHEEKLTKLALNILSEIKDVKIYGNSKDRVGVISFNVEGVHPHDIADYLNRFGIAVRSGHHCAQPLMRRLGMENTVRISFYIYNTEEEVIFFGNILKDAIKFFHNF